MLNMANINKINFFIENHDWELQKSTGCTKTNSSGS
jgi:hypothetical protein